MMITVIALKSHTADGSKRYKRGDHYQISESSARVLVASKLVRYADEPKSKREYKRRDMRAED